MTDARRAVPGQLVDGRYRLESPIGAGGFGEVWRATHIVDGADVRTVALKLLDGPGAGGDALWLDEVRAVRDVVCDAVPTIFDAGVADGGKLAFISMELLEGETLDARLGHGPVPWRRALAIAREIARALAACHRVGVVHCDLKPQNVFACASGRVCVLDFGVAALGPRAAGAAPRRATPPSAPTRGGDTRRLGPVELAATDAVSEDMLPVSTPQGTRSGMVVGTPGYLPPEAYGGEGRTPEADAFALGILLHRLITGRLPQRLPDDLELAGEETPSPEMILRARAALSTATIRGELARLEEHAPGAPAAIGALIARLTAPRPTDRGAAELEDAIDEAYARPYGVPDPPYVGLEAFDAARAGFLAGREADLVAIAQRLADRRAVVLAGPSGSGKSSLAVAGVAARLDEQLLLGVDGWRVVTVRPTDGDVIQLAGDDAAAPAPPPPSSGRGELALARTDGVPAPPAATTGRMRRGPARAAEAGRSDGSRGAIAAASMRPGALGTVVVIDQLEEVLRLPDADRDRLCEAITALCTRVAVTIDGRRLGPDDPVRVIATVRDDLFGKLAAIPALRRIPEQNLYVVRGVEPNAVPEIVVGPARAAGFRLDDEAAVVAEASTLLARDPGALPLVQFALTRWWERRDRDARLLPRDAWRDIGGIAGALADAAGELYDKLGAFERAAMRRVLVALFRPDGTRERLAESAVAVDELDRRVIDQLVARRLLRRSDAVLEVVHEALGARWPLLRSWLDETRVERELVHDARLDAERWRRAGRPPDLLWRGARLAAVTSLRGQLGDADELIAASRLAAGGQRRRRLAAVSVLAALVVVVIALVVIWYGSDAARQRAETAQRRADAARAEAEREAATNRELRAAAEADRKGAQRAKREAEKLAARMEATAQAQGVTADVARARAQDKSVDAEEQRRKAEVAELRRTLAEAEATRLRAQLPVPPSPP